MATNTGSVGGYKRCSIDIIGGGVPNTISGVKTLKNKSSKKGSIWNKKKFK